MPTWTIAQSPMECSMGYSPSQFPLGIWLKMDELLKIAHTPFDFYVCFSGSSDLTTCLKFHKEPASWESASAQCLHEGGYLPRVEEEHLHTHLAGNHPASPLAITWSSSGECVFLTRESMRSKADAAQWAKVLSCFNNKEAPYFCQYELTNEKCGGGADWTYFGGGCFQLRKYAEGGMTFEMAEQECQYQQGGWAEEIL